MSNLDPNTQVQPYSTKLRDLNDNIPGAALTAQLTTITYTAPGTPDYALQDLVDTGGFGFKTKDEGNSVLKVIANLQTRVSELETRLQAAKIIS